MFKKKRLRISTSSRVKKTVPCLDWANDAQSSDPGG